MAWKKTQLEIFIRVWILFLQRGESDHETKQSNKLNSNEFWGGFWEFFLFCWFSSVFLFAYGKAISDGLVVERCHSGVRRFGVTGIWKFMNYL